MSDIYRILHRLDDRLQALETAGKIRYTKGTWTPTYLGFTTAGTTTYTTQAGFYTRIGRVVFFCGRVVWTAATGTGSATISLPFASANTTDMRYSAMIHMDSVTFANNTPVGRISPGDARIFMRSPLTNAVGTDVAVEAAGDVIFSGFIFV